MRTGPGTFNARSEANFQGGSGGSNKEAPSAMDQSNWEAQDHSRVHKSAPGKLDRFRASAESAIPTDLIMKDMEEGEVIPATTYEPSKDVSDNDDSELSGDFSQQVNQVFSEVGSGDTTMWKISCATFCQDEKAKSEGMKFASSALKITELDKEEDEEVTKQCDTQPLQACELNLRDLVNPSEAIKAQHEDRRWSKRVQQKKQMGEAKELKIITKKRSQEGLHKEEFHGRLLEGVQVILSCAHRMMARDPKLPTRLLLPPPEDQEQDDED
ncbi:unnamed protein product [Urochloa humidicola]